MFFILFHHAAILNRQFSGGKTGCATTRFGLESRDRGYDMIFLYGASYCEHYIYEN
jgi:hypothetical protein